MNKKKGFTLIELLAIIVILAVIAVITVPLILNIINDAQKNASIDSAYGYKSALEKYYMKKVVENTENELPNGYKNVSELPEDFIVSGEAPSEGWVKLKKGIVDRFSLKYDEYVVTMDNDKNVTSEKQDNVDPHVTDDYQEIEYLESTGTQYIDTGVYADINTKAEFEFELTSIENANTNIGLFGAQGSNQNINSFSVNTNASKEYLFPQFGNKARTTISNLTFNINTKYKITLSKDGWYYDNTLGATWSNPTTFTTPLTLTLFKVNAIYANSQSKFYNTKIYDDGSLARNLVPVIRKSDNKPGMLDLANQSKNLFDKENATIVNRFVSTDKKIATSSNARSIIIPCQPNTTYTFSKIQSTRFYLGYTKAEIETGTDVYNNTIDNNATHLTITTGENAKYLVVYVYNSVYDTNTTLEEILDSAQLEFGSIATQYEPYGYKFYTNNGTGEFIAGPEI